MTKKTWFISYKLFNKDNQPVKTVANGFEFDSTGVDEDKLIIELLGQIRQDLDKGLAGQPCLIKIPEGVTSIDIDVFAGTHIGSSVSSKEAPAPKKAKKKKEKVK